ncbi:hypothetical protein GHF25_14160 [Enterococcus faecium]|nr:hypothetical protein [Enterococcus faecium]MCZ2006478.1 hypothetical protein [Enterococcus faecium]QEX02787.1 hypothetical protein F6440_06690 [Enterococcus faecium]HAQ8783629.1 hypothetical protein [Enterococcus faecium]HBK6380375.1 hypothetical protein [Enterococcus faecium]
MKSCSKLELRVWNSFCLQSEKRIISSLFSIIYRFSLFFGKGAVSKMVKSGNVANISYLMI